MFPLFFLFYILTYLTYLEILLLRLSFDLVATDGVESWGQCLDHSTTTVFLDFIFLPRQSILRLMSLFNYLSKTYLTNYSSLCFWIDFFNQLIISFDYKEIWWALLHFTKYEMCSAILKCYLQERSKRHVIHFQYNVVCK